MGYVTNSRKSLWSPITALINRQGMLLAASMFLLSLGASGAWAQDGPLEAAIPQRCASKYPEKVRQIRTREHQANLDREEIRKAQSEVATRERQAEANEKIAKGLDERAKLAREKNNIAQARGFEADANTYRDERDKLRREAAPYRRKVENLERSVAGQQVAIDRLVRELLTACGIKIDQGGDGGGNQVGGNQGGGNQGGGKQGGGNQGGGNTANAGAGNSDPTIRINLPNGGYRLLHRDQNGLVFKVEEFDHKGLSQSSTFVNKFSPEGQILESTSVSYGYPGKDKHKEIRRTEKYDENGLLVETGEYATYWDKSRHTKTTTFKDFGNKFGYQTMVVTEDGQTKTYIRDENGNWEPKEEKKPEPPKGDPQKPDPAKQDPPKPEQKKQEDRGDMRCLAGKWRSNAFSAESGSTGGLGLILIIKANGEATADYSERTKVELIDVFTKEVTQTQYSGVGSATVKAENNGITIVRRGPPAIKIVTYRKGQRLESTHSGLGPLLQESGTFTCGDRTLTIKSEVETYTFNRIH